MMRVLYLHPDAQSISGGGAVAAWMLHALAGISSVTVLAEKPINFEHMNRYLGTTLSATDFRVRCLPLAIRALLRIDSDPHSIQGRSLLIRLARCLQSRYDVVISCSNEMDLGGSGIQYVHYPYMHYMEARMKELERLAWHQRLMALFTGRLRPWMLTSGYSFERMKQNLTLVNSDWTGRKVRELYGIETTTLYPPVPGEFPDMPWHERENGFVCIGRFSSEKKLESLVEIVAAVRSYVPDVRLHIVGTAGPDRTYYEQVRRLAADNAEWILLHENLPRAELVRLVASQRYGLHGMQAEHFGIAVAEMVRAGCVVFVHDSGGQVEIVGDDERLRYQDVQDAVAKIVRVVLNPGEQAALVHHLAARIPLFSADQFTRRLQEIVTTFVKGKLLDSGRVRSPDSASGPAPNCATLSRI